MEYGGDTRHLRFVLPNHLAAMYEVKELNDGLGLLEEDDERCQMNGKI